MSIHYIAFDYGMEQPEVCSHCKQTIEKSFPIYVYRETRMKMNVFCIIGNMPLTKMQQIEIVVTYKTYLVHL